ncbi:tolB protein precursor, periplasmic protein involved in the tonb-independent uptake of group A colicins [hydrothermal vent metagenome]|uniref:TolB protein, periplasmic protein involved in the tonb-independent uptake of group A colicins n=1 Tax=hydrothermal vent metagenome TaxID=652676 RepID=A0A3B1BZ21_9ZZZZ
MNTSLQPILCAALGLVLPLVAAAEQTSSRENEQRLLSNTRQLIFEGRRAGEGYFSSDGRQMIFQSERDPANPFYQIYLMDLESGDLSKVSPGTGKTTCGWIHPNGEKVMFSSSHADPKAIEKQQEELEKRASGKGNRYSWSFDEQYDIYEANSSGGQLKNLTNALGYDAEGSWSPDGKLIAFGSNRHAYSEPLSPDEEKIFVNDQSHFMEIYIMDADGANVRRLTDVPGYDGGPFFSPDGKQIVWRRFTPDGTTAEIWTMNIDGTNQRQITYLKAMSWAPFFHPSGDYIIFATNLHGYGNFELYMVALKGSSKPVRVTNTEGFDSLPVFTPDGKSLSWTSSRTANKKPQIFMASWDDATARELLGIDGDDSYIGSTVNNPITSSTSAAITPDDLHQHLSYLASDKLAGRLVGTEGERLATAYVASVFQDLGLQPAGDMGSWFQAFEFTSGVALEDGNRLTLEEAGQQHNLITDKDWRPLIFSGTGKVTPTAIVFAGYGIVAPAYNSYAGLDVKDKWVLAFRFMPEDIAPDQRQHLSEFSSLRYKAMVARDKGARGLILISGPNTKVKDQLVKLNFESTLAGTSIAVISITDNMAEKLLTTSGKSLKTLQSALDSGKQEAGFNLPGLKFSANIRLHQEQRMGRNVLARLNAGEGPGASAVVIGAHIDHIGDGVGKSSLAGGDEAGQIHPGADDNASGVSALLEIAQYLADQKRQGRLKLKQDILFAAWSGEELGLLGSSHFTKGFAAKGDAGKGLTPQVTAYLNLDMVGRLDKSLHLLGVGSSSIWAGEIERRNVPVGLSIKTQNDTFLPTDATSFYLQGVPILSAFTGSTAEYNTPRDTADLINYPGLAKIARLMALITRSVAMQAEAPDFIQTNKPSTKASRANLRAFLGTIPDYANTDTQGVKINGVTKGTPGEKAGILSGDIIMELAGQKIENIYDYTHALNALKVGQEVEIAVQRDGTLMTLKVVPEARE